MGSTLDHKLTFFWWGGGVLLFELITHANKVFFHPHLMELSVSTESELITYISLGLGRTRLLHLTEAAEQPRMGGGKSTRGTHHVRQNVL